MSRQSFNIDLTGFFERIPVKIFAAMEALYDGILEVAPTFRVFKDWKPMPI